MGMVAQLPRVVDGWAYDASCKMLFRLLMGWACLGLLDGPTDSL